MRKRNRLAGIIITAALMIALLPATAFAADYDLWVGGVQVTDANKDNITGTPGVATFDSDTKTLTLNNYNYTGLGHEFINDFTESSSAAIYSGLDSLNITVKGVNELSNTVGDKNSYGIYVNGDDKLTVIGGTVTAQGKTRNVVYLNDGGQGEAIPAPDSSPNTGDNSNMILWLALLLVSGGAIIVAVVLGRKRK